METRWTRARVLEKLREGFRGAAAAEALLLLDAYADNERERVQLALLRLSGGDLGRLGLLLDEARRDYRNTLSAAEYDRRGNPDPGYAAWLNASPMAKGG